MKPWKESVNNTVEKEIESLSIRDRKCLEASRSVGQKAGSPRNPRETKVSTQRREITSVWHRQPRTILDEIGKQLAGNEA